LPHEIIVVDNSSSDGTLESVSAAFPDLVLLRNEKNIGFGAAVNQAAKISASRVLWFLNPDCQFVEGSVTELLDEIESNLGVGVWGTRVVWPDGRVQTSANAFPDLTTEVIRQAHLSAAIRSVGARRLLLRVAGSRLPRLVSEYLMIYGETGPSRSVDWVSGASMLVRREVFSELGGFDERFFMYYEDTDFCRRARRRGYDVIYRSDLTVSHAVEGSAIPGSGQLHRARSRLVFFRKHHTRGAAQVVRLVTLLGAISRVAIRFWDRRTRQEYLPVVQLCLRPPS
jgi:GT2 family glycosyltransferase